MSKYNINDKSFTNSNVYQKFKNENPSYGRLRIRAYSANEAVPISKMKVVVSTSFDNDIIVFYDGLTDESGVIEKISLPVPKIDSNNLLSPSRRIYEILASYKGIDKLYQVNMFEDVCVVQDIVVNPDMGGI